MRQNICVFPEEADPKNVLESVWLKNIFEIGLI